MSLAFLAICCAYIVSYYMYYRIGRITKSGNQHLIAQKRGNR